MANAESPAVASFLSFSLPEDTPRQVARIEAIAAAMATRQSTTPLVGYHSTGVVLIIGPEPYALSVVEELLDKATVVVLATDVADLSKSGVVDQRDIDGHTIPVLRARAVDVLGHLGSFNVKVEFGGEAHDLAGLLNLSGGHFDIVLDLSRQPFISLELPPPGYFAPGTNRERIAQMLEEIGGLSGAFEKPQYVRYNAEICAHGARGITGCTRCVDHCPAGAIASIGEWIEVDAHRCHGMGSCSGVCPTGALTYAYPSLSDTLNAMRRIVATYQSAGMFAPCILLYDEESAAEQLKSISTALPDDVVPWRLEEAGSTGIEVWLGALAYGAGAVRIVYGERTPDSVRGTLAQQIGIACDILKGLGHDADAIGLLSASEIDNVTWPHSEAKESATDSAVFAGMDDKRTALRLALDHLTPLNHSVEQIALPPSSPFGQIHVDRQACTLCMGCVSVCPTGALADGVDTPRLDFIEWNCVQCGLCQSACPESAIRLEARLLVDPEARRAKRNLNQEEPFGCIACGKPFATRSMIDKMSEKLAEHRMFQGEALDRLKMCEDCRVKSMFES